MDEGSLAEEIEVLEAIYVEELDVQRNEKDEVTKIILELHPATGDDLDQRFVCMTLILDLSPEYPNVPPDISIKNPRGIAEEELLSLREDMHKLCEDRKGGPVLFELIELAKESLTAGNIPHCPCMICLEHFTEGEKFTKTECYHYFHESCLSRYVTHTLTKTPEILPAHAEPSPDSDKLVCPLCREEIHYKVEDFDTVVEDEKFVFTPTAELQELQVKMAAILERQKASGGIIDIEAERNKYLVKNDDVVLLALPKVQNTGQNDQPGSRNTRKEKDGRESLTELMVPSRDKECDGYKGEQRPKSNYVNGKGRGNRSYNPNDDRRREKRWKEEKRERTREGNDSDHGSRERTKKEYESSGSRRHWRDENRNFKNRNFKGGQPKDGHKQVSLAGVGLIETAKINADGRVNLTEKEDTGNKNEMIVDKVSVQDSKDTKTEEEEGDKECSNNQQAFGKNVKGNRGGFDRPYEKRNEKEENSRQNIQKYRRGGFGRPERNRYRDENYSDNRRNRGGFGKPNKNFKETSNEVSTQDHDGRNNQIGKSDASESLEDSPATADNTGLENKTVDDTKNINDHNRDQSDHSAKGNRGGFGRPERNRYRDENYSENRRNRGGFGKPNRSFKKASNEVSAQDYVGKSSHNDKDDAGESLENSPATADNTGLENKTINDTKNIDEHNRGQSNYSAKGSRGDFGRPLEGRGDYKDKSYNDVRSTTEYSSRQRGGFRRHEKEFYDDEHYRDDRRRQNKGGFGKPKKDYKEDKSRPSTSETSSQSVSESNTCSPRTVYQSKDESRDERPKGDRYSRDNRYSGRRRFEDNRKYSDEGKPYRDARTGINARKPEFDKKERVYRDSYGNKNARHYHDSYEKGKNTNYSESTDKEFHRNIDSKSERNKGGRQNREINRIDGSRRDEGKFGKRSENNDKKFESMNESNFVSQSEETDACSNSTVNKFNKMSISDDSFNVHQSSCDFSVNEKSSICDRSGDNKVNNSSEESKVNSEIRVRDERPPGFTIAPPPGFQRTAKDNTQVVQSPPGFSQ